MPDRGHIAFTRDSHSNTGRIIALKFFKCKIVTLHVTLLYRKNVNAEEKTWLACSISYGKVTNWYCGLFQSKVREKLKIFH